MKKYSRRVFSSLKIYNYRLYFIGQMLSMSGTWMQSVAQALLILQLTGSGVALGIVIAMQYLPILFLASFGGLIADRYSKRKIMFITQAASGLLALIQGILYMTGMLPIWAVYVLALGLGIATAFDNPTKQAFVFEMVGVEHIKNAVSLNSMMVNLARVIGPLIAGVLVPTVGLGWCFIVNGISFAAVLIVLFMMRPEELRKSERITHIKGQITEGFLYILRTPLLRNVILMVGLIGTFTFEFGVILPLFAQFTFHNATEGFALLYASLGVGSICGGLYGAASKKTSMQKIMHAALLFGLTMFLAAIAPTLTLATIAMVFVGFFSIMFLSLANAMLQSVSEPEMRGRVMSLWSIALLGSTPIGGPIIGWIGEVTNPRWGLAVGGLAAILAGLFAFLMIKRDSERILTEENQNDREHALSDRTTTAR